MGEKICVDLYSDALQLWMEKYNPQKVTGTKGIYYTTVIDSCQKKELLKEAHRHRIKYRWYERKWSRSSNYRDIFFKHHKPPYRCRYCNRKLTVSQMVIDHIVPISQVKKSARARRFLTLRGIQNINDPKNLAPSCSQCNSRKSDKMSLWIIRGVLGEYKLFWALSYLIMFALTLLAFYSLHSTNILKVFKEIFL